ncbi:hypothetical protein [Burkholderia sp. Bp9142]|uniref:hypothetical protein n=1 Tax=Burkholderia sp. Bp9142 TaxID=2184573 RepID=UPI000F5939E3|nr:hypothetical protein [Burkholderia sp. Bp9142]RQR34824.1 hypothetical protein DIE22_16175 [Burkholderia sp. Bp9142]
MGNVMDEAAGVHAESTVRLTLDELEAYDGLTAVLREYGFLYKEDMELFEAMVRRHDCLRPLIPYAVSAGSGDQAFARMNIALLRAAIVLDSEDEHQEAKLDH